MMKKELLLFLLCFTCVTTYAQEKFTIEAAFSGLPDDAKIELLPGASHKMEKAITETTVSKGAFSLEGKICEPRLFLIAAQEQKVYINIMVSPGDKIKIGGDVNKPEITGATLHPKYVELYVKEREILNDKHRQIAPNDNDASNTFFALVEKTITNAVKTNKDSWWGPFLMMTHMSYFTDEQKEWYDWLSEEAKNSHYGKIVYAELFPPDFVGKQAPDFKAKDVDGKEYGLDELLKVNDYILIDFWASWCGPCRKSIPMLKEIAEKYREKGLKVVGISCDKDRNEWVKAIEKEQLSWVNLNDTQGIMEAYGVKTIPALFLIDKSGIVLGDKLHGESLTKCLTKVFAE